MSSGSVTIILGGATLLLPSTIIAKKGISRYARPYQVLRLVARLSRAGCPGMPNTLHRAGNVIRGVKMAAIQSVILEDTTGAFRA
ncbi:hypothetical protein KCP73_26105 [Salmonella enterica subsp. enterica]|nr:hypothetical protein KCP73_26105 [Salmonella enterica subsp. enterica]